MIAKAAEMNILTVGVTTLPFLRETERMRRQFLFRGVKKTFGATITVPIKIFKIANESGFEESFVCQMMFKNMVYKASQI